MCHRYLLDGSQRAAGMLSRLAERFPIRREDGGAAARTYLDTFDWRLYRDAGTVLSDASNGTCSVQWDRFDGRRRHRAAMPAPPAPTFMSSTTAMSSTRSRRRRWR